MPTDDPALLTDPLDRGLYLHLLVAFCRAHSDLDPSGLLAEPDSCRVGPVRRGVAAPDEAGSTGLGHRRLWLVAAGHRPG
ncbi:MAG: hypothetical protein M3N52_07630 [Actinomycetota bacterium]|nr:hypothetical protein [Actinomycetota bacterium]